MRSLRQVLLKNVLQLTGLPLKAIKHQEAPRLIKQQAELSRF